MNKKNPFLYLVVFLTSFTILSYEVILTQIFSIIQWQNLSSIIISIALLGFGTSGSFIFFYKEKIENNFNKFLFYILIIYPLTICLGFIIFCLIPFNPFELGINNFQMFYLLLYFIILGVQFFFGASIIGIAFLKFKVNTIYFSNLLGSGLGAFFIVLFSFYFDPYEILIIIIGIALSSAVIFVINSGVKEISIVFIYSIILLLVFQFSLDYFNLKKVSQYKTISAILNLPESKILYRKFSPLGLVQVVQAKGLRSSIGLSLNSPFNVPEQKAIFYNGEGLSPIIPYDGDNEKISYLDYMASSLPFIITKNENRKKVLVVGVGGGESILKAIKYNYNSIYGLELNKNVISLMKNNFSDYSGNIYNHSKVKIINKEARSYARTTNEKFNLIDISMLDTFTTASSGVYALNESYLYTVESIKDFYNSLDDNGILSISRWIVVPAKDNLKLFNICITALKQLKVKNIESRILCLRSMQNITLLISKSKFTNKQINIFQNFCKKRLFDMVFYAAINNQEVNNYIKFQSPIYYNTIKALLGKEASSYVHEYKYDISHATDNRPYFYNFFKSKLISDIVKHGSQKIPFTEWGYFILIILLVPVLLISFMFIVFPVLLKKKNKVKLKLDIITYFACIAIGYFFIEMCLIQKMILFLAHPTYSISVIISSLLVFSGIGSYFSEYFYFKFKKMFFIILFIIAIVLTYIIFIDLLLNIFIDLTESLKILIVIFLLFPLGFFMGMPFPVMLKIVKQKDNLILPWALSINGFFSVISIIVAVLFSIFWGFNVVLFLSIIVYFSASLASLIIEKKYS